MMTPLALRQYALAMWLDALALPADYIAAMLNDVMLPLSVIARLSTVDYVPEAQIRESR